MEYYKSLDKIITYFTTPTYIQDVEFAKKDFFWLFVTFR